MVSLITIGKAGRKPRPYHTHLTSRSPRPPSAKRRGGCRVPTPCQGAQDGHGAAAAAPGIESPTPPAAPPPDPAQAVW